MIVTHKIKMDLTNRGITPVVDVMQDDQYSRNLEISLYTGNGAFALPEECAVLIRYKKPDGQGGFYDSMPDGTRAWSADGNAVTVALAPQVCTVAGNVSLNIVLLCGCRQLSSFEISLRVGKCSQGNFDSAKYVNISNFLPQAVGASVGQLLKVAEVDVDGKVTAVAAEDRGASIADMMLIVNAVSDGENYELDHTMEQINAAYDAGKMVYCRLDGSTILPLTTSSAELTLFSGIGLAGNDVGLAFLACFNTDDLTGTFGGGISLATEANIPESLPNPESLRFTGAVVARYRGDASVTVRIPECVPVPPTAAVGQVMAVSAVNDIGVVAAWQAVDPLVITSSGGSKYKIIVDDSGNLSTQAVSE